MIQYQFSRSTTVAAVDFLGAVLTHAKFDQVVLHLALEGEIALGSRKAVKAKSVLLGRAAVKQPTRVVETVDGLRTLPEAIVLAAVTQTASQSPGPEQQALVKGLARDGFILSWEGDCQAPRLTACAQTVADGPLLSGANGHRAQPASLAFLLNRHSQGIKHLSEPGPTDDDLTLMVEAALSAPDHAALVPFRFKLVRDGARDSLAQLFATVARSAGKTAATVELEEERVKRAPVIVAVVARLDMGHPLVPVHEQWVAIGGAVTNFLNAAHALGFAGKILSGAKVRHPDVVAAFCETGETLLAWISLGTASKSSDARRAEKPSARSLIRPWP